MDLHLLSSFSNVDIFLIAVGSWFLYRVSQTARARTKTTKFSGPLASSWVFGVSKDISEGDSGAIYEKWADDFGPVYQIPGPFGSQCTVLMDAKSIANFYSKETFTYVNDSFSKQAISSLVGKGIFWAEGENHRRQRKMLTPAFSNAAIRDLTPVFYDSGYKVKSFWDALFSSSASEELIIDVQKCFRMNCISLDSIGIAGFGHDFGSLNGRHSDVGEMFDSLGHAPPIGISMILPLLGPVLPFLTLIPTTQQRLIDKLHMSIEIIAKKLLMHSRKEKEAGGKGDSGRSIIGALLKAESLESELRLSQDEVLAQMKVLIMAGYETTSISLTWALIELSLHPEIQVKLREELSEFAVGDPSYDQINNGLPYLDSVTREILRLHPPLSETRRVAAKDDVIPLSEPLTVASGSRVDRITIGQGTSIVIPIQAMNRAEAIWGSDAKKFNPERWLNKEAGLTAKAREIQGYHHLMTFVDGPRMCLGRAFAVIEIKTVLSVLIRNYTFDMRDGPETKVDIITTILPRPKVAGEKGYAMPMRVRRIEI
ncbi:hypothetical protein EW145_g3350 [Phellinidium pouzarii]|uniref:Cytochrome P450 n=1 Tax=Phellinidium pouzarii TaxID=167371 RepID=A0A4S4LCR8_9AGAM|nr:hypothetical protein EW145_g3350 [Phellinidium pouzarii]